MIYFDNAATSFPKPAQVAEAVAEAINTLPAPNRGAYPAGLAASRALFEAREEIARFLGHDDLSDLAFTSGATEALNTAINGLLSPQDHVITTVTEHNAVLRPLYRLGCALTLIPCDELGRLALDTLPQALRPETRALLVSHVSNVTGNAADISYVSAFCRENGLYLILDCAQSAGCLPLTDISADVLCFSGHKALFGPQGTGGLIVNRAPVKPFKTGGTGHHSFDREQPSAMPERLEAGTPNLHGIMGLRAGVQFINSVSLNAIQTKEAALTRYFAENASRIKGVRLYGDFTQASRGAVVALSVQERDSAYVSAFLERRYGIATRAGIHCAPLLHKALGTEKTGLTRFSFSYFNTLEEIDYALEALAQICAS